MGRCKCPGGAECKNEFQHAPATMSDCVGRGGGGCTASANQSHGEKSWCGPCQGKRHGVHSKRPLAPAGDAAGDVGAQATSTARASANEPGSAAAAASASTCRPYASTSNSKKQHLAQPLLPEERGARLAILKAERVRLSKELLAIREEERSLVDSAFNAGGDDADDGEAPAVDSEDEVRIVAATPARSTAADLMLSCNARVEDFLRFVDAREQLRTRIAAGVPAEELYVGFDPVIVRLFQEKQLHNVSRNVDPVTLGLKAAAISFIGGGAAPRGVPPAAPDPVTLAPASLGRPCILMIAIWRVVAGTLPFALALGPLYTWTPLETSRVQALARLVWAKGKECVDCFFSNAYSAPRVLRNGLFDASQTQMERIMWPSAALREAQSGFWRQNTLIGRLKTIDSIWEVSGQILDAGRSERTRRSLTNALAEADHCGIWENGRRLPGFFAKELGEDALDIPGLIVPCLDDVQDLNDFCPAGPGALQGLEYIFQCGSMTQEEANALMRALWHELRGRWRHAQPIRLHDIQFMLCAHNRTVRNTARNRRERTAFQRMMGQWVAEACAALAGGAPFGVVSAQFVARLQSLPDVR
ncbi:unnamed protein product [Prorocentrum cordatum]|uniref:Uncharacterized protein n=1 Tax=Prorocentrum cordatum TaxID=2364126 RepID=A0ABN9QKW0_9DINO|nr:unnamed protein product [Polarella glacialis]